MARLVLTLLLLAPAAALAQAPQTPTHAPVVEAPKQAHAQKPNAEKPGAQNPVARKPNAEKPGAKTAHKAPSKPARLAAKPVPAPAPPPAEPPAPPAPEAPAEQAKGSVTGLPLPRFAALRTNEVNLRAGPGTRYPIDWVYKRQDLPVEIEREFEVWRLVRDADGVKGWVHQATLVGRREFMVTGDQRTLRQTADESGAPVAMLKPGVIGRIRACDATQWCEVQVQDYRGFLKRAEFWGAYPAEVVGG